MDSETRWGMFWFLFLFLQVSGICRGAFMLTQQNVVIVSVDEKEVYRGSAYGVGVESSGSASKVLIYGEGFFAFALKYAYVSNNVKVIPGN